MHYALLWKAYLLQTLQEKGEYQHTKYWWAVAQAQGQISDFVRKGFPLCLDAHVNLPPIMIHMFDLSNGKVLH